MGSLPTRSDVACLKDHAHAAVTDTAFELIATVKDRLACNGLSRGVAVVRTVVDVIGVTATADRAFFHLLFTFRGNALRSLTKVQDLSARRA